MFRGTSTVIQRTRPGRVVPAAGKTHRRSARAALRSRRGVLKVVQAGSGRRATILAFPDLLNIAEGRKVF